jgi:hypothetical protein
VCPAFARSSPEPQRKGAPSGTTVIQKEERAPAVETPVVRSLVVFVIVAIAAGMLAAIFPARRASRLNVLRALQYE